jgi:SAP domain-containing protein
MRPKLRESMTEQEFDNGYWYAMEVKAFAKRLGIESVSTMRKDELEHLIKHFLRTGRLTKLNRHKPRHPNKRDSEKGLTVNLKVVDYVNDRKTKEFIDREARRLDPGLKLKSGARYRLNRWREEQIGRGNEITYGDLVQQYMKLNRVVGRFPQVQSGRYINFLSDFLRHEENATRVAGIRAWKKLKGLEIPKTYSDWKNYRRQKGA